MVAVRASNVFGFENSLSRLLSEVFLIFSSAIAFERRRGGVNVDWLWSHYNVDFGWNGTGLSNLRGVIIKGVRGQRIALLIKRSHALHRTCGLLMQSS